MRRHVTSAALTLLSASLSAVCLLAASSAIADPVVYHSTTGVDPGAVHTLPRDQVNTPVEIWIDSGDIEGESAPGTACDDGTGDETCGLDVEILVSGDGWIASFTPDAGVVAAPSVFGPGVQALRANAIFPSSPPPGPRRIGVLGVDTTGANDTRIDVIGHHRVGAALQLETLSPTLIAQTPPVVLTDSDLDGIPDHADNCLLDANPSQLDSDGDDYGNLCDCDFNQNLLCEANDFLEFGAAYLMSVPPANPEIDMDGDGLVDALDFLRFGGMYLGPPGPSGTVDP